MNLCKHYLDNFKKKLSSIELPQGLHHIDLYIKNEQVTKQKLEIIKQSSVLERQLSILQSYIFEKLTQYRQILSIEEKNKIMEKGIRNSKKIFIIHGHNEAKRRELKELLKDKFGLEPIILSEQPDNGLTIIEKFEKYASDCSFAFALFTPDDIVSNGGKEYFQARPNVIFELGWFYANLGRSRVCILDQENENSRIFSDLQGVMRMQFKNSISEKFLEIEKELTSVGII